MGEIYQRQALNYLRQWRDKSDRKPLVIRGARQVGKTTLVNLFGEEFDNYLYLNLEEPKFCHIFDGDDSVENVFCSIHLTLNKTIKKENTLLFIDEIQNSARAVAMLRYFYEQMPWLHVIAAGSMLENLERRKISFPVGRVEYMALRPFSFIEFLAAMGHKALADAVERAEVPKSSHVTVMQLFNSYTLIGGMPAIVKEYAKTHDLVSLDTIYDALLTSYRDDVEKYAPNNTLTQVIRHIITNGLPYAAKEITLGGFAGSNYKAREVGEAFRLLEKSMLAELIYPSTQTEQPAPPEMRRVPRLFWVDTGLVNFAAELKQTIFDANDIIDVYKGKIAEHIVGQELLSASALYTYRRRCWVRAKKGSDAEMDFVYNYNGKLVPIEVKSGTNAHLRSLQIYMDECPHNIAIRVWSAAMSVDKFVTPNGKECTLVSIPFYYVSQIKKILAEYC